MNTNLTVKRIYGVYEGEFNPGYIARNKITRHSDCFVYFPEGEAEYIFEDYILRIKNDSVLYLSKESIYDINIINSCKYIYVDFDFKENPHERKSCAFSGLPTSVKSDFIKLFYTWNTKNSWHIPGSCSILYNIYAECIKAENKGYAKQHRLFSKITSYILENYTSSSLRVEDIAGYAGISEVHLRRIFKCSVNTTPISYINQLRLEKAKNMLIQSNLSINEIANSVGFEDAFYFSRFFKKEFGISPSKYKKTPLKD